VPAPKAVLLKGRRRPHGFSEGPIAIRVGKAGGQTPHNKWSSSNVLFR